MSTAIAMAPSPAPHDRPSYGSDLPPSSVTPSSQLALSSPTAARAPLPGAPTAYRSGSGSPNGSVPAAAKSSPPSASRPTAPKIIVKKEPASPDLPVDARRRPRKLDLSKNTLAGRGPLTARESGGLGIQEVGIACLSPGFVTQDPIMKEQLQRSLTVREQQRHIIEARLQQQSAKSGGDGLGGGGPMDSARDKDDLSFVAKTPGLSRRNKAGLAIVAPSHEQFANERVIQSAPLGQTFTGRHNPHPLTRHITNQPMNLSSTSHMHAVPAKQTDNRLPPIADVFGHSVSGHPDNAHHHMFPASNRAPLTSPGHPPPGFSQAPPPAPPQQQHPHQQQQQQALPAPPGSARGFGGYKTAEEAQAELAGGRPELLPRLVHYGGHQPPTPPSPQMASRTGASSAAPPVTAPGYGGGGGGGQQAISAGPSSLSMPNNGTAMGAKRRTRAEYEDGGSPPLGNGPAPTRRSGPFGAGRDSPETQRAKRDEFLRLCERAWDLFHS